ncbi:hypothetical protein F9802_10790 [Bacillus aerolatus]|uniref:Uncharacterized protein n=1 Tax=Bacillus aerolatus TaxID=2653354 RepID=A0A6I1FKV2_9BACI|nr:hypothetical protein [Bacillus aerolatus]KAB7706671.1 hypothetical protein F9802_10790 [Bacillus aerolatus]
MIDFSSLPSSEAEAFKESPVSTENIYFTFEENIDEQILYRKLNERLSALESSVKTNNQELAFIHQAAGSFKMALEEKEEVIIRIDWLRRLYEAKEAISSVDTKEEADYLRRLIASVQTCPMKNELVEKIDSLEQSLPSGMQAPVELSRHQKLMEKAIREAGDVFINLGKTGREHVITGVLERFGNQANVERVKEQSATLEESVKSLLEVKGSAELISRLEQLPLASFSELSIGRKKALAERLLKNGNWDGLASIDRMIVRLDQGIKKEEQECEEAKNKITTPDGKAALTLDVNKDDGGIVKFDNGVRPPAR